MSATTTSSWLVPVRHPSPDDLELWLENRAAAGQVLDRVTATSPLRMTFTKSEPRRYRYALERRETPAPGHYFTAREERGWEHVGAIAYIQVWRREYADERPAGFIGADLGRRAALASVGLGVVAALSLLVAVILGAVSTLDGDLWIPAVVLGVLGLGAAVVAAALALSHRSAATAEPAGAVS